jgi:RimJ/RimL family protein N-acetyltransferase
MKKDITLTEGNVTLRAYRTSDIDSVHEAVLESMAELSPWMPWAHSDYSIEDSRVWVEQQPERWERGIDYNFAITDTSKGMYLGGCGLNGIQTDFKVADLGYWVRTSRTKQGIATMVTGLLARFAFNELKLNRVAIVIAVGNKASLRVAEKAGAVKEGILRNGLTLPDGPSDAVMHSLIPQDMI